MDANLARIATAPMDSLMQPFLLYVLARAFARQGISDAAFGRALGRNRSSAKRLLDGHLGYTRAGEGIDAVVTVAADMLGMSPIELWTEALEEWEKDPEGTFLPTRHEGLRAARLLRTDES